MGVVNHAEENAAPKKNMDRKNNGSRGGRTLFHYPYVVPLTIVQESATVMKWSMAFIHAFL